MARVEDVRTIAVLLRRIYAQVDANADLLGVPNDRHHVIDIVVLDDGVEPDVVDTLFAHARHRVENPRRQPGNAPSLVVPIIQIVERDAELVDSGVPKRPGAL